MIRQEDDEVMNCCHLAGYDEEKILMKQVRRGGRSTKLKEKYRNVREMKRRAE